MLGSNKRSTPNPPFSYVATVNKLWLLLFFKKKKKIKINPPKFQCTLSPSHASLPHSFFSLPHLTHASLSPNPTSASGVTQASLSPNPISASGKATTTHHRFYFLSSKQRTLLLLPLCFFFFFFTPLTCLLRQPILNKLGFSFVFFFFFFDPKNLFSKPFRHFFPHPHAFGFRRRHAHQIGDAHP
jgi:hypothetical protein